MKKLVISLAILFGIGLISCGHANKTPVINDSDSIVDTVAVDSTPIIDSIHE